MKGQFIDIKTRISYTQHGDYYLPDVILPPQKELQLNRFGRARLRYLKEHERGTYNNLLISCKLYAHLTEVQEKALKRFEEIVDHMKAEQGVTEELKNRDQMTWVREMNNIRSCVEEMVLREIMFA
ncbi:MAG TPA: TnpV protein [Clostridia bacterium]|nr:TnpV protein [Clostridia bacterium]